MFYPQNPENALPHSSNSIENTVEPRFNEPLFNDVLDITNDSLRPDQNYSKMDLDITNLGITNSSI